MFDTHLFKNVYWEVLEIKKTIEMIRRTCEPPSTFIKVDEFVIMSL